MKGNLGFAECILIRFLLSAPLCSGYASPRFYYVGFE
jgi:hypothetical protein